MGTRNAREQQRPGTRRGGLGRGLDALIPSAPEASYAAHGPVEIPVDAIAPNPYQPRTTLDQTELDQLAASIRAHGVIQPLIVTAEAETGRYTLIAGERRWRAARSAGLATVPVIVKEAASQAMLELALVENVARADLSPLEEANAYRQLVEEFGLTQAEVAERAGRSRVSITNTLRLLGAPGEVQAALLERRITEGHARALLGLPSAVDQIAMLDAVLGRGWNVRQTEDAVRRWNTGAGAPKGRDRSGGEDQVEERLQRVLATKVGIRRDARGSGAITIHFYSDEQLHALCERLGLVEDW